MTDTSVAATEMVAANLGCAMVIERFAHHAVDAGREICIVGDPVALGQAHYLSRSGSHQRTRPDVDAFETWLHQTFRA